MNSLLLAMLLTTAAPSFEVQTLDGQTIVGSLVELSADRLTIDAGFGHVSLDTEKLVSISAKQKPAPAGGASGVIVELADGSMILGRQYVAQGTQAKITLAE